MMNHSTCKRLFDASKALLTSSGLVRWNGNIFVATHPTKDDSAFEKYARTKFHPCYGRYMCWVLFSVGAENLAKAACTCSGVVKIPNSPSKLPYPIYEDWLSLKDWGDKVLNGTRDKNDPPQPEKYDFGDLGEYWQCEKYLDKLCNKCKVLSDNRKMLKASYKYLAQVIRNRDAHTYIANQRRKDFPAVKPIFVPSFNILVKTMEKNGHFKESKNA